ncbi:uncharacterized protein MELLADRAFT_113455 [Melampsora larici-populina 98AG31]|uniref:Uncharacterized protein n=1 Tax=Melampsora larici-populina (strain 98AG31 / pathotype 3-4-7) TaxID=747676 RepID=F4S9X3_MELLP|nr:uncharacterized protein MELLADRAFT_113455 [Melampsora larici-populina 98AG31]EGF98556.1 hypothetical protein MELLADRAFT_113455 [Melampsora larici-populina 98AG31]
MKQLQTSVNKQDEELTLMRSHNEEVIKLLSNLTLEQLRHDQVRPLEVAAAANQRQTPPHMTMRPVIESHDRKLPTIETVQVSQQYEHTEEEVEWSRNVESLGKTEKGKNREITIKHETPPDNELTMVNAEPVKWLVTQKKRLQAAQPSISKEEVIDKILEQCTGDLDHAVRSRLGTEDDFVRFTTIFEEVVRRTSIGRQRPLNKPNLDWKTQATSGSSAATKPNIAKPPVVRVPGKCDTCGSTESGHDFRACRRKSKNINVIEGDCASEPHTPTGEELEIIFNDDHDSLYDDGEYRVVQDDSLQIADISHLEEEFRILERAIPSLPLASSTTYGPVGKGILSQHREKTTSVLRAA